MNVPIEGDNEQTLTNSESLCSIFTDGRLSSWASSGLESLLSFLAGDSLVSSDRNRHKNDRAALKVANVSLYVQIISVLVWLTLLEAHSVD